MQPTRQMRLYKRRSICPIHVHPLYDVQPRVLIGFAARVWYFSLPLSFFLLPSLFVSLFFTRRGVKGGAKGVTSVTDPSIPRDGDQFLRDEAWTSLILLGWFRSRIKGEGKDDKVSMKLLKFSMHYSWDFDTILSKWFTPEER